MAWVLLLLTILSSLGASIQQLQSLKDPDFVAQGGTITMSCRYDGGTITDNNYPRWIQQKAEETPRLLIHSTSSRPSGVPARFSGSRSGNTMSLTITGALVEDEATYYCLVWIGNRFVFGGGTQLTVTGQPTVSPTVNAYTSSEEEIKIQNKATLVCLLNGFYPPAFNLKWKGGSEDITSGVETTKAIKQGDKYVASSYLTLSTSEYQNHDEYTCEVTHGEKTFVKTVRKSGNC